MVFFATHSSSCVQHLSRLNSSWRKTLHPPLHRHQPGGLRRGPRPNPTYIKVLPKEITGDDVIKLMRQYEVELGVECEFCHARNPETKRNDFASDAPGRKIARLMIEMTDELNEKYLAELVDHKSTGSVTCGTCHRGMSHPETFIPKTLENRPPGAYSHLLATCNSSVGSTR